MFISSTNKRDVLMKKIKGLIFASVISLTQFSMAEDMATRAEDWAATFIALQALLVIGAALVGLGMMAAGGMQLKKHGENPQQVPLNKGLIFLAAGALLFGLSSTSETMQDTVFGTGNGVSSDSIVSTFE